MAKKNFQAVPTELIEHAETLRRHLDMLGYRINLEPHELGYPQAPTIVGKLRHKTVIYEACSKIDIKNIRQWVAFCKSCSEDTRFALCIPESSISTHLSKHQKECQSIGVGIYVSDSSTIKEFSAPKDLSLKLELPDLSTLPKAIRSLLGPAYELINRGEWREGFFQGCKALEQKAANYLVDAINTGRLNIYEKGVIKNPTPATIKRLPLGALKDTFSKAQPQNSTDSMLFKTLKAINPDRIPQAHKVPTSKQEANLRKNVGTNMHAIVQALKSMT